MDLRIDSTSLGKTMSFADITSGYAYKHGERTDKSERF